VYIPNQLLVKFRAGAPAATASALHSQVGASVVRTIEHLGVQVVRLAPGASAQAAISAYRAAPFVEYAEQDAYVYATATPNDPLYLTNQFWHYNQINLPTAWDTTKGSAAVIVAVIDTGIRDDHPDLAGITSGTKSHNFFNGADDGNYLDPGCPTVDSSEFSHGTHVAGTVAALSNNGMGVAGVNWGGAAGTKIMAVRVLGEDIPGAQCGTGSFGDLAAAITYAANHGAKVINMSLGAAVPPIAAVETAISYAIGLGVTLVAAAGNSPPPGCAPVIYPASNPNVIAVGALGPSSTRASYSNCGPELAVVAPGGDGPISCIGCFVWSTSWRPSQAGLYQYVGFQGTSMATPHVSGVVALMLSRGITGPANIKSVLQSTATCLGIPSCPGTQYGSGRVDAAAAVGGGSAATRQCAFSGVISGTTITPQSELRLVAGSGAFTITNAQSGTKSVFVWQDVDGSNTVNTGDIYGRVDNVSIFPGMTTPSIPVTVRTYGTGLPPTPPPTLSVPGGTASCF